MADNRKLRFDRFFKRIGEPDYLPDFLNSLLAVMANGDRCMNERVLCWAKYRAWGNQSEYAVHICSHEGHNLEETALGQENCAHELAWLEAGDRAEWLDAPLNILRAEMTRRGIRGIAKSSISRAFGSNLEA